MRSRTRCCSTSRKRAPDRKSTRLNSSHLVISYAVFCLKKKIEATRLIQPGKVHQLGHLYEHGIPLPRKRPFKLTIPGSPTDGPGSKKHTPPFDVISTA